MKRGQVSVEFAVLMVFMMFLLGGIFVALQSRMVFLQEANNLQTMSELGNLISSEIRLAIQVGDGYQRDFVIPPNIGGDYYNTTIEDNVDLIINYRGLQYVDFLDAQVLGTLNKGKNKITNSNGIIVLS